MQSFYFNTLLAGLLIACIVAVLRLYIVWTQDKTEPPVLAASIPFITPIIGIFRERTNFMVRLRNKYPSVPIYTLRLPGTRIYVINDPTLIPHIQRQKNVIVFEPIPAQAISSICGASKAAMDLINGGGGERESYFKRFLKISHPMLSPGSGLEAINRAAIQVLMGSIESLESVKGSIKVDLWHWVRHEMFIATTEAIYGPYNPFRSADNEEAWYEFEDGMMLLLMGVHKMSQQGRISFRAREKLVAAFDQYYDRGYHNIPNVPSLRLVQACYDYNTSSGLPTGDIVRSELGQIASRVSNTIPGGFWMLWHVISDPAVLADCRAEIEKMTTVEVVQQIEADGRVLEREVHTIDLSQLTNRRVCPVIMSTWHEVLRYNHVGISARVVLEDTHLDGYLLKKDSTTMVVSSVMHSNVSAWGPTAGLFRHRRFLQNYEPSDSESKETIALLHGDKKHSSATNPEKGPANRLFGGGATLCPGRHFASQEVLSFLALTIMRFDFRPVNGESWTTPEKVIPLPTALPLPKASHPGQLDVELISRHPKKDWRVIFGTEPIA